MSLCSIYIRYIFLYINVSVRFFKIFKKKANLKVKVIDYRTWHRFVKEGLIDLAKKSYFKSHPSEKLYSIKYGSYEFTSRPDVIYLRKNDNPYALFELETYQSKNLYSSIIKGLVLAKYYHGCRFILIVNHSKAKKISEDFIAILGEYLGFKLPECYVCAIKGRTKEEIKRAIRYRLSERALLT